MQSSTLGPLSLGWSNLMHRPLRSLLLMGMVALFTFSLLAGSMISLNLQAGIYSLSERLGADMLVVPDGSGKKVENVLLRSVPTTFYLPEKYLAQVASVPGVAKASGQLFVSSLKAQCCSVQVQLIGIDPATDFVVGPWLKSHFAGELKDDEIIVGNYIVGNVGETLKFYDTPFKIVAQLEPTGMGFDASVFMTLNAARRLGMIASPDKADKVAKSLSSILIRVKPGVDPMMVSDGILDRLGLRSRVNFVYASALMSDTASKLRRVVDVMVFVAGILWVVALVVLLAVFFFAANERKKEFATLRSMGASKSWVLKLLTVESLTLGVLGSLIGVVLGALVVQVSSPAIAHFLDLPYLSPSMSRILGVVLLSFVVGTFTAPLAALPTLARFSKDDIYTMIREGE